MPWGQQFSEALAFLRRVMGRVARAHPADNAKQGDYTLHSISQNGIGILQTCTTSQQQE